MDVNPALTMCSKLETKSTTTKNKEAEKKLEPFMTVGRKILKLNIQTENQEKVYKVISMKANIDE